MNAGITGHELTARRVCIPGTYNLRDIGGYPTVSGRVTRSGQLLRGDALHRIDDIGRLMLSELGLQTVIDLRNDAERSDEPDLLQGVRVKVLHRPIYDSRSNPRPLATNESEPAGLADIYGTIIDERGKALTSVIRDLASRGALPAVVHCTAGKDRTGIVIALLLACIGVSDETISADFAATSLFLTDEYRELLLARAHTTEMDYVRRASLLTCEPPLILDLLAHVRRDYGDVPSYLRFHGLEAEELDELQRALLENTDATSQPQ